MAILSSDRLPGFPNMSIANACSTRALALALAIAAEVEDEHLVRGEDAGLVRQGAELHEAVEGHARQVEPRLRASIRTNTRIVRGGGRQSDRLDCRPDRHAHEERERHIGQRLPRERHHPQAGRDNDAGQQPAVAPDPSPACKTAAI